MKYEDYYHSFKEEGKLYMQCKLCRDYIIVSEDTKKVTCGRCNAIRLPWPNVKNDVSTGRPSGWHWMHEFVDSDGNVYHKGVEQPKLKGTLKPTKIKPKKKRKQNSKKKKDDGLLTLAKIHKDKLKIKRELNKK